MELVNLKLSPAEAKEITTPDPSDGPKYPYGLRISLDDDTLKKLGLTELPAIDTKLVLTARAEVCSTSDYDSQSGSHRSLDLQITELALEPEPAAGAATDRLFPSMAKSQAS